MKNMQSSVPATRKDGLTISMLDGEVLVYDPVARRASCLNSFAAEVLSRCDGQRSASDITRDLPFEDVDERMVLLALADLQKAQLLQDGVAFASSAYRGANRRDLLKRIGLGAAVAVPIVAGIATPSAAQVATCIGLGVSCPTGPNQCCPGLQCTGNAGFKTCTSNA